MAAGAYAQKSSARRSGLLGYLTALVACAVAGSTASAFLLGSTRAATLRGARTSMHAEAEEAKTSVALIKVTEESKVTTASVIGGVAGLLVGGVWVGGALFAATAYLARKEDDDVSKAIKGVASTGLEAINFAGYLGDKYDVTSSIGTAMTDALSDARKNSDTSSVIEFFDGIGEAVTKFDQDVGIKDTVGNAVTSASDLASQAVSKALELNDQYKITDQIADKIKEVSNETGTGKK